MVTGLFEIAFMDKHISGFFFTHALISIFAGWRGKLFRGMELPSKRTSKAEGCLRKCDIVIEDNWKWESQKNVCTFLRFFSANQVQIQVLQTQNCLVPVQINYNKYLWAIMGSICQCNKGLHKYNKAHS